MSQRRIKGNNKTPAKIAKREPTNLADPSGIPSFQIEARVFRGPIPPPNILADYNTIIPNGAERIMAMAERQAEHRQTLENKVISSDVKRSNLGLVFGFLISVAVISSGTWLILAGHSIEGMAMIIGDLATLAGVFVYGSNSRKQEREAKVKTMTGQGD